MPRAPVNLQYLLDKAAIEEVITRYFQALDRLGGVRERLRPRGHRATQVHVVVDDQAPRPRQPAIREQLRRVLVQAHVEPLELEGEFERETDGLVVVDDEDRPRELRHCGARSFVGPA